MQPLRLLTAIWLFATLAACQENVGPKGSATPTSASYPGGDESRADCNLATNAPGSNCPSENRGAVEGGTSMGTYQPSTGNGTRSGAGTPSPGGGALSPAR